MKIALTVLVAFVWGIAAFSQSKEDKPNLFDEAFYRIYMHTASEDVSSALQAADSLYRSAENDLQRVRSLMLISDMHHRVANRDSSIHYAVTAGAMAEKFKLHDWQARIYGVLSTQYREIGLWNEGKRYLAKGIAAVKHVAEAPWVTLYKAQYYQEMGFYAIEETDYRQGLGFFERAAAFLDSLPHSPTIDFSLAQNEERLGYCYLELGVVDSAKQHYLSALELEQSVSDTKTPLKGFIYNGLGRVFLNQQLLTDSYTNFEQALEIAEVSDFPPLKMAAYSGISLYYKAVNDYGAYVHYNELYLAEMRENVVHHKQYADNILTVAQQNLGTMLRREGILIYLIVFLVLVAAIVAVTYHRKQKRYRSRFISIIKKLREGRQSLTVQVPANQEAREVVPEVVKMEILKKLERFEGSLDFTNKNMSLAVLAGKMKTNTKYLSHVVNNHKRKDFNTYINELRINYIVSKMEKDRRYLNYKISYLAEECGFSTHSQFTTIFKNVLGLSPSKFIAYLREGYHKRPGIMKEVG